eukprot:gene26964-32578_t
MIRRVSAWVRSTASSLGGLRRPSWPNASWTASPSSSSHPSTDGQKLVDYKALESRGPTHGASRTLIKQRARIKAPLNAGRNHDWDAEMQALTQMDSSVEADDPLHILYTSRRRNNPRTWRATTGGYTALHVSCIIDVVIATDLWGLRACGDVGWAVARNNIVYGPLLQGRASVLYEGKPVVTLNTATVMSAGGTA